MALQEGDAPAQKVPVTSNVSLGEYVERVLHAKEYIAAGDIFQVVPSQRFSRPVTTDPFTVYRALRTVNPSPYMFYVTTPDGILVGASPELLVRVEEGIVTTHPIAGTVPRGKTPEEDEALATQLLNDEKEKFAYKASATTRLATAELAAAIFLSLITRSSALVLLFLDSLFFLVTHEVSN